jgi:hypothetical protein
VNGFTVVGDAANYTLQSALAGYSTGDPNLNGNGITVSSNHVIIENNTVYNEPGGGIGTGNADYVQILNNVVYNNSHWSPYGTSGISIAASANLDNNPGAHIIVSGNLVYGNSNLVPEYRAGAITDGEGIILDSNEGYTGQILVQNNTVYGNGSSGIESFLTDNAVITGNTVYGNDTGNVQPASDAQILINQSNNNTVTNNVTTAPSSTPPAPPTTGTAPSAPKINSFSPDTGVVGDGITNANKLDLKGTADPNSTVTVYDGATKLGTTTASSTGSWDYITAVLTDAKHILTATETNSSSQTSIASAPLSVTVDTQAPAAPVVASDSLVNTNQAQLSGTAEPNSSITVYDGTSVVGTATTNSSGAWSATTSVLSNGTPTLTAKATDVAGNVSAASQPTDPVIPATPTPTATPPAAPKIVSFSPDDGVVGDHITNDSAPTLNGTASANSTVTVYDGTTKVGTAMVNESGQWTLSTTALSDGTHNLTATDTDLSGHTSTSSLAFAVTIDTHAPSAPTLAAYSQAGATVTGTTTLNDLVLKGTAEAASTIDVFDGGKQIGTATANGAGAWSYDTGHLANGNHSFTAVAIDSAGNISSASMAMSEAVTTPPPVIASTSGNTSLGTGGSNTLTGTPGHHVHVGSPLGHSPGRSEPRVSFWTRSSEGNGGVFAVDPPLSPSVTGSANVTGEADIFTQRLALFVQGMASNLVSSGISETSPSMAGHLDSAGLSNSLIAIPQHSQHA